MPMSHLAIAVILNNRLICLYDIRFNFLAVGTHVVCNSPCFLSMIESVDGDFGYVDCKNGEQNTYTNKCVYLWQI
jgi:hypothetical protein